jgi:hypothetical protein
MMNKPPMTYEEEGIFINGSNELQVASKEDDLIREGNQVGLHYAPKENEPTYMDLDHNDFQDYLQNDYGNLRNKDFELNEDQPTFRNHYGNEYKGGAFENYKFHKNRETYNRSSENSSIKDFPWETHPNWEDKNNWHKVSLN